MEGQCQPPRQRFFLVVSEMFKASGEAVPEWVADVCNVFRKDGELPEHV